MRTCTCGVVYTPEEWKSLPFVGMQHVPADDEGPEEWIELRTCSACGTTRAGETWTRDRPRSEPGP